MDWWNSLSEDNQIILIVTLLGGLGYIFRRFLIKNKKPRKSITGSVINKNTTGGMSIVHNGSGDIKIGITLDEYEQMLKCREVEIRTELEQKHKADRNILEKELSDVNRQLHRQNIKNSFAAYTLSLKERIAILFTLFNSCPNTLLNQAITALQKGDSQKADHLFKQITENNKDTLKLVAEAAHQRGKIAEDAIRYVDALKHFEEAVRITPENALYLNDAGLISDKLAFYEKAADYYMRSLESLLKTHDERHPFIATTRNNLGEVFRALGQYDQAISLFEKALASDLESFGEKHPHVATTRNNLGLVWLARNQHKKAIDYFKLALESDLETFGKLHPDVARDYNNLGGALESLGKYHEAILYYEKALEIYIETYGKEHPHVATIWNNLGGAWDSLGNYYKAIEYYERALKSDLKTYGKDHPSVATTMNNLGLAWKSLGEY